MKDLIKKIIILKLDFIAKLYLWRFKPDIIAITGNVGKTSTKEAVAVVLSKVKRIRTGKGNLNNEFGVPLTILGDWGNAYYEAGNSLYFWLKVLFVSFLKFFTPLNYPEVLILEYGADKPGDIGRLVSKYKPKIGIITAVGDIPVHVEYFNDPDRVAKEKSKLITSSSSLEYAILNHDDPRVYEMRSKTKAKVWSYGFTEGSKVLLSNFHLRSMDEKPEGVGFKIHYGPNSFVPVSMSGSLGKSQAYVAGAAASVGLIYDMNLIEISQALELYDGPKGRLKILEGMKKSYIIDDTYNAAPSSMHLALETLRDLPLQQVQGKTAKRRIAVLGDMLELGKYAIEAHYEVGNFAASFVDILITVGSRGKLIADAAEDQMKKENIFYFPTSDLAKIKVQELIGGGDLILVKGSQGVRMEKIVEEIMAEPSKKKELLVRQNKKWLN